MEIWRPARGVHSGRYEVSNQGRIRSTTTGRVLRLSRTSKGYYSVHAVGSDGSMSALAHRMVCHAFHGDPPPGKQIVLHWDGDRQNNAPENLRWGTHSENTRDAQRHGTYVNGHSLKTHCPQGHEYNDKNTYRPPSGGRYCRTCHRESALRYYYDSKNQKEEN